MGWLVLGRFYIDGNEYIHLYSSLDGDDTLWNFLTEMLTWVVVISIPLYLTQYLSYKLIS